MEIIGDKIAGIAVSIGARIGGMANPCEVLVSQTTRDLVEGSGLEFEDRGEHVLKGVPGQWRVFAATSESGTCYPRSAVLDGSARSVAFSIDGDMLAPAETSVYAEATAASSMLDRSDREAYKDAGESGGEDMNRRRRLVASVGLAAAGRSVLVNAGAAVGPELRAPTVL